MGWYVHFSITYSARSEDIPRIMCLCDNHWEELVEDDKVDFPEIRYLLDNMGDRKNYNEGRKGCLFTWGIVGNYLNVEKIAERMLPLFEKMLRLGVGVDTFDHIVLFEEQEQSGQAKAYEIYLEDRDYGDPDKGVMVLKKHELPFCWGQM